MQDGIQCVIRIVVCPQSLGVMTSILSSRQTTACTATRPQSSTCSLSHLPYQGLYKHQARLKWKALIKCVIIDIARCSLPWERRRKETVDAPGRTFRGPCQLHSDLLRDSLKLQYVFRCDALQYIYMWRGAVKVFWDSRLIEQPDSRAELLI